MSAPTELGQRELTSRALARLSSHDWPGNVRELRSVLYRALDFTRGAGALDASDVDRAIQGETPALPLTPSPAQAQALYAEHGFNLSAAARAAGMARTTFRKLLKG